MTRPLFPRREGVAVLSNGNDLRRPPVFEAASSHPMIDDFSMRASRQRARAQPPGVPMQFPLPLRNNPMWSGNNEIGNEVEFAADANNRQMVIKMEEWGEPQVWTAMLGIAYTPNLLSDTSFFDLTAEVQAGVGGATQEFEVDWGEGTQFSCPANTLVVTAKYTVIGGTTLEVPADLKLRATVGRKPYTNPSSPTRSLTTESIGIGGLSLPIIIPKFARRLTPLASFGLTDPYAATTIYFWQNNPTIPSTIGSFTGAQFLNFASQGIPVPTDARALIVFNNGVAVNRIRLMFHLAL